jgi:hypothetical protein
VEVDGDAIPTGNFINVTGTPWDFTSPQKIDYRWNETVGLCGGGSSSDITFIYDLRHVLRVPKAVVATTIAGYTTTQRSRSPGFLSGVMCLVSGNIFR